MMATGRTFSFEEALQWGIVSQIFGAESFSGEVMDYARQFCPPGKAALAVGKRAIAHEIARWRHFAGAVDLVLGG